MNSLQIQDVFQPYYAGCREAARACPPKQQPQVGMPIEAEEKSLQECAAPSRRMRHERAARER